ncbi:MAG: TonB-dependent receptor [Verrucomicrobiota bacterium]
MNRLRAIALALAIGASSLILTNAPRTLAAEMGATNRLDRLMALKLEDILNVEVTSVSKRPEKWFEAPAALFVISGDDLRRSGARSFPDALRLAPGVSVAQADANTWAVSPRGFSSVFADKLLVLIDGRTVYSPLFNGVFWNIQDYVLEDIDRIEVIRGPGGALWGANAVNGVINIITKDAQNTQGLVLNGGGGTTERGFFSTRYGSQIGDDSFARVYFNYRDRAEFPDGHDSSRFFQGGFRSEWKISDAAIFTVQGDGYHERHDTRMVIPNYVGPNFLPFSDETFSFYGGNLLTRYTREFGPESELQFQAYYDRNDRQELGVTSRQDILDVDVQHRFALGEMQTIIYGAGYRYYPNKTPNNPVLTYSATERHHQLFSAFIQDEVALLQDRLKLTLGTKIEHNDITGFEIQPSGRVSLKISDRQMVWGAVSRAIQMPGPNSTDISVRTLGLPPISPIDLNQDGVPDDFDGNGAPDTLFFRGFPAADPESQTMIAYELGYRIQATDALSFDVAGFYNQYDELVSGQTGIPFGEVDQTFHLVLPIAAVHEGEATTYGFEVSGQWQATEWWRLSAWYAQFHADVNAFLQPGRDPENQVSFRSSMNLTEQIEFDLWTRYVDQLPAVVPGGPRVKPYFDLDVRLAWRPKPNVELAVVGQNLVEPRRIEFSPDVAVVQQITAVPRGVYGSITVRF